MIQSAGKMAASALVGAFVLFTMAIISTTVSQAGADGRTQSTEAPKLAAGQSPLATAEQAEHWLRSWADALPEDSANHGRRTAITVSTDPQNPQFWSVRTRLGGDAVPVLGWAGAKWPSIDVKQSIDKFACVAITSATGRPVEYPTRKTGTFLDSSSDCDGGSTAARLVDPAYSDDAMNADWQQLVRALETEAGRANPYLTANSMRTGSADYSVLSSTVVSSTETRLEVLQTATGTGQLTCEQIEVNDCDQAQPPTQTRTVVVSTGQAGTGPVTLLQAQQDRAGGDS